MEERAIQFRVGLMFIATVLIALALLVVFGTFAPSLQGTYLLHIKLREAPGVAAGTPVNKFGIRIGEVSDVRFTDDDQVLVTVRISNKYTIHRDEACRVQTNLLGESSLEFDPPSRTARQSAQ